MFLGLKLFLFLFLILQNFPPPTHQLLSKYFNGSQCVTNLVDIRLQSCNDKFEIVEGVLNYARWGQAWRIYDIPTEQLSVFKQLYFEQHESNLTLGPPFREACSVNIIITPYCFHQSLEWILYPRMYNERNEVHILHTANNESCSGSITPMFTPVYGKKGIQYLEAVTLIYGKTQEPIWSSHPKFLLRQGNCNDWISFYHPTIPLNENISYAEIKTMIRQVETNFQRGTIPVYDYISNLFHLGAYGPTDPNRRNAEQPCYEKHTSNDFIPICNSRTNFEYILGLKFNLTVRAKRDHIFVNERHSTTIVYKKDFQIFWNRSISVYPLDGISPVWTYCITEFPTKKFDFFFWLKQFNEHRTIVAISLTIGLVKILNLFGGREPTIFEVVFGFFICSVYETYLSSDVTAPPPRIPFGSIKEIHENGFTLWLEHSPMTGDIKHDLQKLEYFWGDDFSYEKVENLVMVLFNRVYNQKFKKVAIIELVASNSFYSPKEFFFKTKWDYRHLEKYQKLRMPCATIRPSNDSANKITTNFQFYGYQSNRMRELLSQIVVGGIISFWESHQYRKDFREDMSTKEKGTHQESRPFPFRITEWRLAPIFATLLIALIVCKIAFVFEHVYFQFVFLRYLCRTFKWPVWGLTKLVKVNGDF